MEIRYPLLSKNQKGFTFVELMAVITITGIIVAIALPALQKPLAEHMLYISAREMENEIREIQHLAMTGERYNCKIRFYSDSGRNVHMDHYLIMDGSQVLKKKKISPMINLYKTNFYNDTLRINISGVPANTFGGTVTLENNYEDRLYVIVAKTGRVRISTTPPIN